jgi:hypothetical protein
LFRRSLVETEPGHRSLGRSCYVLH